MESKPEETTSAPQAEVNGDETKKADEGKTHDIDYGDPEEDEKVKAAGLADVAKTTGVEGEKCIYKQRVKLYRFGKDATGEKQWRERGVGNAKMFRNDESLKIRFVMR